MRSRIRSRLAVIAAMVVVPVLAGAGPALALHKDDGEVPGPSLGTGLTILYFVVIPLGVFLIISGLCVLPSALRRPRYRPGKPWTFDPLWFRGPQEPQTALQSARAGETARGGASAEW
ncbi:MAG TPA: hypothetical protein VHW92_01040 [Mycobacteriales bacterium]|nr:hypothetical protein [Mycobacteriales bacterium]